jgi:hypothetical protein
MAYPQVSGPYGLQAVNEIGGLPYAGSTRMIPIVSGYTANLFYGQIVQLSGGTLVAGSYTPATNPTTVTNISPNSVSPVLKSIMTLTVVGFSQTLILSDLEVFQINRNDPTKIYPQNVVEVGTSGSN